MSKPDFIDNQSGNKLVTALKDHLQWRFTQERSVTLDIATGYVNPEAFSMLADELEQLGHLRLLLGADPLPLNHQSPRRLGEKTKSYDRRLVEEALKALSNGLKNDRDLLGFEIEITTRLKRMLTLLKSDKVEIRKYPTRFMHGKAYIFSGKESYLVGSSNFTAAGLASNLELNVGRYDPRPVKEVANWFEELWEQSEPFDLASIYEERLTKNRPYLVFLRILYELYGEDLEKDFEEGGIGLTDFQQDGVKRSERILEKYNGVIIADGVGLGKTYLAGKLIENKLIKERKRVLLVGPAALVKGPWARFMATKNLRFEAISFHKLADLNEDGSFKHLDAEPEQYDLIVIDEAQAYRTPDTTWSDSLRRLLRGRPPKKVVMLSATPVNNSLWDLYYMLMFFIGNDAAFAEIGIRSLRNRFQEAQDTDPFTLNPDLLFEILDATTIRRTRKFIREYYPDSQINIDGKKVPILFPKPHTSRIDYQFTDSMQNILDRFIEIIAGTDDTEPELTMARYSWGRYIIDKKPDNIDAQAHQVGMTGLIRVALLKRLESSVYALGETCERMVIGFEGFLQSLEHGLIPNADVLSQWIDADSLDPEEFERILIDNKHTTPVTGYDVKSLRADVEHDLSLISELRDMCKSIDEKGDSKLDQLVDELKRIIKEAEKDGKTDVEKVNNRKVLLFSYFEDTLNWIQRFLEKKIASDAELAPYRGRVVSVSGTSKSHGITREKAVFGFAPTSTDAPPGLDKDLFDLMLTTDVLAEGQNLQQCRNIINYDLPWNPMRLVQRHGRIDRINSRHEDIWMRCFFPAKELDILLDLENRIQRKVAQAARSIGVENPPIPNIEKIDSSSQQQRREIEKLREENSEIFEKGGTEAHAFSGEEFRRALELGINSYSKSRILSLAWGSGSSLKTEHDRGFVFCAKIGEEIHLRFVPESLDPEEIGDRRLDCLRRISCNDRRKPEEDESLESKVYSAWDIAKNSVFDEWEKATDPVNITPKVRPLFRKIGEWLRDNPAEGKSNEKVQEAMEAIEAPWDRRRENHFRKIFKPDDCTTPIDKRNLSLRLIEEIKALGLEAYRQPKPLAPIEEEEIALLAWVMLV